MREKYLFAYLGAEEEQKGIKGFALPAVTRKAPLEPETLDDAARDALACKRCGLRAGAGQVVFGEGNQAADLMFVGEGPGADEDEQGRPFVGAAGQLLNKILAAAGITREEVYIANIVKCRPPGNRLPSEEEANACLPHLQRQIKLVRPRIIVCLGALAARILVDPNRKISELRGTWFESDGMRIMPTYHPAALLRDPAKKRPVWEDIKKVRDAYRSPGQRDR